MVPTDVTYPEALIERLSAQLGLATWTDRSIFGLGWLARGRFHLGAAGLALYPSNVAVSAIAAVLFAAQRSLTHWTTRPPGRQEWRDGLAQPAQLATGGLAGEIGLFGFRFDIVGQQNVDRALFVKSERQLADAEVHVGTGRKLDPRRPFAFSAGGRAANLDSWPARQKLLDQHSQRLQLLPLNPQARAAALAFDQEAEGALAGLPNSVRLQTAYGSEVIAWLRQVLAHLACCDSIAR
jgi:hypothetical protein